MTKPASGKTSVSVMPEAHMNELLHKQLLGTQAQYADAAFARNLGLIDYAGQKQLGTTRIAIAGMGGVGGVHLMTLARTGIGRFHLADMDAFSVVNVNRQFGATASAFGKPKLQVMVEQAREVNPYLDVKTFESGINTENLDTFLTDVDLVVDGIDFFAFEIRRALFNRALEHGIPVITAGPIGYSAAMLIFLPEHMKHRRKRTFLPGTGYMGFDEYFAITEAMPEQEKYLRFAMGLTPRPTHLAYLDRHFVDLKEKRGPSLHIACQLCAALTATEAVRILLSDEPVRAVPQYTQYDPKARTLRQGTSCWGNNNIVQKSMIGLAKRFLLPRSGREGLVVPKAPASVPAGGSVTEDALEYVIRAGVQAPSGDNVQPWWVIPASDSPDLQRGQNMSAGGLTVVMRPEADQSFFNVRQMASVMSCGAVVENMRIAAAALGLGPEVSWLPEGAESMHMARIAFAPDGLEREEILHDALWRRCTNRQMYRKAPLPVAVQERVSEAASAAGLQENAIRLDWISGQEEQKLLAKAVYTADRIRVERKDLHEYFMSKVLFSKKQEQTVGLPLDNLCAGAAGNMFLRITRPWSVMSVLNRAGASRLLAMHSMRCMLNAGGAGLLTLSRADTRSILTGGQALERIWILLEHMGFAFQPMAAITLFRVRELLEGSEAFSEQHQELMEQAWDQVDALFPASRGRIPLMLFRAGRGPRLPHGTYRKDWTQFVKQ